MDVKGPGLSEKTQHFLLILGLGLLVSGASLILVTTGILSIPAALCWTAPIILGLLVVFGAYWKRRSSTWLFIGFLLIVSGTFFITIKAAAPHVGLLRLWPFCMVFVGLSIFPAGFYKSRRLKASFFIPSACFIVLGCFFLLFSLGVVTTSLRSFIARLWPFFFIMAGIIILGLYIGNRIKFGKSADKEE
jgi:hypothetical protein